MEYLNDLTEYVKRKKNAERRCTFVRIIAWIVLILAIVAAFFYLPSKIADTISYYQSKKYGKKNWEDESDGGE